MKVCSHCKRDNVEFHKNTAKADGLQTICKICKKSLSAKYFQDDKGHHKNLNKSRKDKARQFIFDYLLTHPCIDCGEKDPIVLEFDHKLDKIMSVSETVNAGFSLEKISLEIDKCEVRCANCHRRKTAKQLGWYKNINGVVAQLAE